MQTVKFHEYIVKVTLLDGEEKTFNRIEALEAYHAKEIALSRMGLKSKDVLGCSTQRIG